jgi:hypothetical protein
MSYFGDSPKSLALGLARFVLLGIAEYTDLFV